MMKRNYRARDLWREESGFETALAVVLSLDSAIKRNEESEVLIDVVKSVFEALTVAMSGNHIENRKYMHDKKLYQSLAATLKYVGLIGTKYDTVIINMVTLISYFSA